MIHEDGSQQRSAERQWRSLKGTMRFHFEKKNKEPTCSSDLTSDINHCCSSLCSVDTSSTEHFLAATLATLCSSRLACSRLLEPDSMNNIRSSCLPTSFCISLLGCSRVVLRSRGVFQRLLAVKSMRIKRTESLVNCSRQKGQTGDRRVDVFSMIELQQVEQSTWPVWVR